MGQNLPPLLMFYILSFLLCGISFAPLAIQELDIWHAQGIFAQGMILIALSWSFFEKPKRLLVKNVPLGLLNLWIGIQTLYICYLSQVNSKYDVKHFFLYFNFLCLLILYNLIVQYLNKDNIIKILGYLRYVVIITLFTCVLQRFNLSQFFKLLIDMEGTPEAYWLHNNPVIGFIGNGTHLSGFLACTIPIFLWHGKREDYLALILMGLILCQAGTTIGDPSISGFAIAFVVWIYLIKRNKLALVWTGLLAIVGFFIVKDFLPNNFFGGSGRLSIYGYYLKVFAKQPVTGLGLGTVNIIYTYSPFPQARHVHMEYLQYGVETGIIGLVLIGNLVNDFFHKVAIDKVSLCLKACVLGFLVSCCFNYPSHLWLPATWAFSFYAFFISINRKEIYHGVK